MYVNTQDAFVGCVPIVVTRLLVSVADATEKPFGSVKHRRLGTRDALTDMAEMLGFLHVEEKRDFLGDDVVDLHLRPEGWAALGRKPPQRTALQRAVCRVW